MSEQNYDADNNIAGLVELIEKNTNALGVLSADVRRQDQTTQPVDFYFVQIIGPPPTTLAAPVVVTPTTWVYDVVLTDATDFSIGNYIGIFQENNFYNGTILAKVDSTITLDTPLNFSYQAGTTIASFTKAMNVNGTPAAPEIFQIEVGPAAQETIHLTRLLLQMKTATAPTLADFGDLTALTNGLCMRVVKANGKIQNIWNIKDNAEMSLHSYDVQFYTAVGSGQDGLACRITFNGEDKRGVAIELGAGDKVQLLVRDNLTGLTEFFAMMHGHFTD